MGLAVAVRQINADKSATTPVMNNACMRSLGKLFRIPRKLLVRFDEKKPCLTKGSICTV